MSENSWRRGERISSGVSGEGWVTDISKEGGPISSSNLSPKMRSKSVRNEEKTGTGMLRVAEKTMQTLRTLILFKLELSVMLIRNSDRARTRVQFGSGSFRTSFFIVAIFLDFSLTST